MLSLTVNSPSDSVTGADAVSVLLDLVAEDDNPYVRYLKVSYSWGDGTDTVDVSNIDDENPTPSLSIGASHTYEPGTYSLVVEATNYLDPTPQVVTVARTVTVTESGADTPERVIFGPILPRDAGSPGSSEWLLNTGSDLRCIESNLKMILLTARGERIMENDAGTNLRAALWEPNDADAEAFVTSEIRSACRAQEPRATLVSAVFSRDGSVASVNARFVANLTGEEFSITLNL